MSDALVIATFEMILRYGVPAFIASVQNWDIEDPTPEDIRALKIEGEPGNYFK